MDTVILWLLGCAASMWIGALLVALFVPRQSNSRGFSAASGIGTALLLIAALLAFRSQRLEFALPAPLFLGQAPFEFQMDRLSAWFLGILGAAALPVLIYAPAYMDHFKDRVDMRFFHIGLPVLLLSMACVALSANVITFLVAWELMALSSFFLVGIDHPRSETRQAAFIYLGSTRLGTAFLAGGFLWLHTITRSWEFADWQVHGSAALGPGILLLVGLGVKAGMWPIHLWLPIAHPAAPSPISALMSGVMVKMGVYMIVRLFIVSGALAHPVFGYTLLALGAVSAFWGVLFALLQQDLKRLLAYSTVENVGLILIAIGGAIVARDMGLGMAARISLAAGLFHALNHALFKSLLFLGAGSVDLGAGSRDLGRLGGLGRSMPTTFACFVLGSAAICALPPLNGFASEWLMYQSALEFAASGAPPAGRFLAMLLIGWIALIGSLAVACFLKAAGVTFLGRPRSAAAEQARETPRSMQIAQITLAAACVASGLSAPAILTILDSIARPLEPAGIPLLTRWTLPTLSLVLVMAASAAALALWMRKREHALPARVYITWECGFGSLTSRMQATASSFAQPIARMFGVLYQYEVHRKIEGQHRRLFPEEIRAEQKTEVMLESRFYNPLVDWVKKAGDWAVRMQAGSIHVYLLTMFATLFLLLALGGYAR